MKFQQTRDYPCTCDGRQLLSLSLQLETWGSHWSLLLCQLRQLLWKITPFIWNQECVLKAKVCSKAVVNIAGCTNISCGIVKFLSGYLLTLINNNNNNNINNNNNNIDNNNNNINNNNNNINNNNNNNNNYNSNYNPSINLSTNDCLIIIYYAAKNSETWMNQSIASDHNNIRHWINNSRLRD